MLESWGLRVEFGVHCFDKLGHFLAGSDKDRLADINDALRDPGVRAIISIRGGKGAYRIAHALALMEPEQVIIHRDPREITAKVMIGGTASGILMGGNLNVLGRGVGWACPSLGGSILLIEAIDTYIGQIDATLTQLRRAGCLDGLNGVAVGQFIRSAEPKPGKCPVIDVLYDQLGELGVPVLGGLPIGHGPHPPTVPLGQRATLDRAAGTLTIEPAVR
jgi:muramoyltetrapeptide carboxypeptidase